MTDKVAKRLEYLKQEIRSVLLTQPNGLTVAALLSDYRTIVGWNMPFQQFGYGAIDDFLKSIPDVVSMNWSPRYNGYILKAVADESTKHIEKLVSKQKSNKSAASRRMVYTNTSSRRMVPEAASRKTLAAVPPRFRHYAVRPSLPISVKNEIYNVLKEFRNGLSLTNFLTAFRKKYGKDLICSNYGFFTVEDCLNAVPEVFMRYESEELRVYLIVEKRTEESSTIYSDSWRQTQVVSANSSNNDNKENQPVNKKEKQPVNNIPEADGASAVTVTNKPKENKAMDVLDSFSYQDELSGNNFGISSALREQFKKIMKNSPQGVWVSQFPEVLRKFSGFKLDHRELGYYNLVDLFNDLPEIFRIEVLNGCKDDWMLFDATSPVENAKPKEGSEVRRFCDTKEYTSSEVIRNIRLLLQANSEGVSFEDFCSLYEANCNEPFSLDELGFDSLHMFLETIAEKVPLKIEYSGKTCRVHYKTEDTPQAILNSVSPHLELPSEFPSDAVVGCTEFQVQDVMEVINQDEFFPIHISSIVDPSHMYIQLRNEKTFLPLEKLMTQLEWFYFGPQGQPYKMPAHYIMSGVVCAAIWPTDSRWHRIRISSVPSNNKIVAFFVDYGTKERIPCNNLMFLKKKFMELPAQAIRSHLCRLRPYSGDTWDPRARDLILKSFGCVPLMASITEKPQTGMKSLSLVLCDVSGESDVFLNDLLVSEGFAKYITNEQNVESCEESSGRASRPETEQLLSPNEDQKPQASPVQQHVMSPVNALSMQNSDVQDPNNPVLLSLLNNINSYNLAALHPMVLKQLQDLRLNSSVLSTAATSPPVQLIANSPVATNFSSSVEMCEQSASVVNHQETYHESDSEVFESDEEIDDDDNPEVNSISKRYVKRINLDDGYSHVHMIVIDNKPYMSSGDITFLLWSSDDPNYVRRKLKSKEIYIPNNTLNEVGYEQLFYQLEKFQVKGVKTEISGNSYITLFPFKNVIDILNIFGHPSIAVRDIVENEQLQFEPSDPFWKTISEEEYEEDNISNEAASSKEQKVNLYELKASLQALKFRKQTLKNQLYSSASIPSLGDEIEKIECQCAEVERRIRELQMKMVSRQRDNGFD